MTGGKISHYEVGRKLGEGGMGAVYQAEDCLLHRQVALKFLSPALVSNPGAHARFEREARAVSALNHPNIGVLYSLEQEGEQTFLVLEYLPGGTLQETLQDLRDTGKVAPIATVMRWAQEIAAGLAHAHRKDVIHRDIKPGNVMFDEEGRAKLTDFGLARHCEGAEITGPGSAIGTPAYMSPEQALGCGGVDHRSDIFSLGVVLYELLSGQRPFRAESQIGLLNKIVHEVPKPLHELRSGIPEDLEQTINRCLEKDPSNRFQSMTEVVNELNASADTGLRAAFDVDTVSLAGTRAAASSQPKSPPAAESSLLTRRNLLFVVTALVAVGFLALPTIWKLLSLPGFGGGEQRKLAVLLFDNVGGDESQQAFCDGLTYSLTGAVTDLGNTGERMWVVPASEVHREKVYSVRDAHAAFGVNLALTGSVRRSVGQVSVTVNLVDAKDARQLASRTLQSPIEELLDLENRLLYTVGQMLELRAAQDSGRRRATDVLSAYEHYLEGRGYLQRFDKPGNLDLAEESFNMALSGDPNYALARAGLGHAYLLKHSATYETRWLVRAQEENQRAIALDNSLAEAHVNLCILYQRTGRHEESISEGRHAVSLDPLNAAAYQVLGDAYSAAGNNVDAENTYRQAISLLPESWLPQVNLGVFYLKNNHYAAAETVFRKVIELVPDNEAGYRNLGAVYQLTGRYDEALAMLEKAVDVSATGDNLSNLGTLHFSLGQFREAAEAYERAVELSPSAAIIWGNLADAYAAVPEFKSKAPETYLHAIDVAKRQIAITRKDPGLMLGLAVYSAKVGEHGPAADYLSAARELLGENAQLSYQSAIVYELAGDRRRAMASLKEAVDSGYPVEEARRAPELSRLTADPAFASLLAE